MIGSFDLGKVTGIRQQLKAGGRDRGGKGASVSGRNDAIAVLVIIFLQDSPRRFTELQRIITGISQKMLTQTLRSLERDGLVTRTVYPEVPPRVEYALTPLGTTLIEPLAALRHWAETYIETVMVAQTEYDQRHT